MTKFILPLALSATAIAGGAALFAAPAVAQDKKVSEVIVYGTDPCPRSTDDSVVVCARRPETERYRIPEKYRSSGPRQANQSWSRQSRPLNTVGNTGINSCSSVGPAGFTGCLTQTMEQARQERNEGAAADAPPQ